MDETILEIIKEITIVKNRINELGAKLSSFYDNAHAHSQADIEYLAMMTDVDIDEEDPEVENNGAQ